MPLGHSLRRQRLKFNTWQLLPITSSALKPVMRSMAGFQRVMRPASSRVKTPSAMASIMRSANVGSTRVMVAFPRVQK